MEKIKEGTLCENMMQNPASFNNNFINNVQNNANEFTANINQGQSNFQISNISNNNLNINDNNIINLIILKNKENLNKYIR